MTNNTDVHGYFIPDGDLEWYQIDNYDLIDPFMVSVVAPDDQWIFVSTSGALTAGRGRAENALFPYETDDRLHRSGGRSGPITIIKVAGHDTVWEPFAAHTRLATVHRSLAKSAVGDRLRFSETHPELGLTFRATWAAGGSLGLIRSCELLVDDPAVATRVELVDGVIDVLPSGVELSTQQTSATLVDAYRRSEFDSRSGLAVFTLEALISDQADPAEALRATTIWSTGLNDPIISLSDRELRSLRSGMGLTPQHLVTGTKGAFLQSTSVSVSCDSPLRWVTVADVGQSHLEVEQLRAKLETSSNTDLLAEVRHELDRSHQALIDIVSRADGIQQGDERPSVVHHFANVLFNVMRGGVFLEDHQVEVADVGQFIAKRNRVAHSRWPMLTTGLDDTTGIDELRLVVANDPDLVRLLSEYLPLRFSRRHGDPSRPWNRFEIPEPNGDGSLSLGYEGNWRDIFQNWEALTHSFPGYIESIVAKFLNATTMDGNNPYRITHDGIDWELPEDGSWSNLGYWGDHQIVYLHRLLDALDRFFPGRLEALMATPVFSYADVPYRIRPYEAMVADPKATIDFDHNRQAEVEARVDELGSDGRLVPSSDGEPLAVCHVTLAEKLLVPAMAKLSNFVAGGGIWLNTQRPEWNDANNALVGNGVSVVTLFHLRHYLEFVDDLLSRARSSSPESDGIGGVGGLGDSVAVSETVVAWMVELGDAFSQHDDLVGGDITSARRRSLLDHVGKAFGSYRANVYANGPGRPVSVPISDLVQFISIVRPHVEQACAASRRPDGLFDAYLALDLSTGAADLTRLYPMLEGQVAALGSGGSKPGSVVETIDQMFGSDLYRMDQDSFLLYPNQRPEPFIEKNKVPHHLVGPGLSALADDESTSIAGRDIHGVIRFGPDLRSARDLKEELDHLSQTGYRSPAGDVYGPGSPGRAEALTAYEAVFNHQAFTGRSQTMYRYEGLGSIYWHMVSKLLFALQEQTVAAARQGRDDLSRQLADRYRRVKTGLGYQKDADQWGSFPTDPHSHSPSHTGAQQPGMTGQVKEGVLIRWGELGVRVEGGCIRFEPILLDKSEFLTVPRPWVPLGTNQMLEAGTLGFTYCGVPVVYHQEQEQALVAVTWSDGDRVEKFHTNVLDQATSQVLFRRTDDISRIDVHLTN